MNKNSEAATKADLKALENSIDARFNDADKRMKKFVFDAAEYVIEAMYKNTKELEMRTNGKIENVQKDLDDWKGHTTEEFIKVHNRVDKIILQ